MRVPFVKNGVSREVKHGFSWTVFFFGPLALLIRGEWLWSLLLLIANLSTFGVSNIVYAFMANRMTARRLLVADWKPMHSHYEPYNRALSSWSA